MIDFTSRIHTAQQEQRAIEQQIGQYQQAVAQLEQRRLLIIGKLQTLIELDNEQRAEAERVAADEIEKQRIIAEQRILHEQALQEQQRASAESEPSHNEQIDSLPLGLTRAELLDRISAG